MPDIQHETVLPDGSFDFAGGVDSQAVTTVRSALTPHGLRRDQLAWMNNATVRGGGIQQRAGMSKLLELVNGGLYQGGIIYTPIGQDQNPYLICSISGHIFKALLEAPFTVTDLTNVFGVGLPATGTLYNFAIGNGFLIIQAADLVTKPLFYVSAFNGNPERLRQSAGLAGSELPAATAMVYYGQRVWYAQNRAYAGGDIIANQFSGSAAYLFLDSILKVTENPLAVSGDGFAVPSEAGNIRALAYTSNLDTNLGQGPLYVFTRKQVFSCMIPVSRADWIAATTNNMPLQTVAQINNGAVGERSIVHINGDLFYQSFDPAVRSLIVATRFYKQWGNPSISSNVNRALQFSDRALMRFASGIEFDNRLLQCVLQKQTPDGVISDGILPLDFVLVSTLEEQAPPAWEGIVEGVKPFHLFTGDFGGLPRAFAVVRSELDQTIDVWEFSTANRFDNDGTEAGQEKRVDWRFESPAFTWGEEFKLKKLHGGEIWVDKIFGTVNFLIEYRPDADPCWKYWHREEMCVAHNCEEDVNNPVCYPPPEFREGYKWALTLPTPIAPCDSMGIRPANLGYQFQIRVTIKGWCRVRGIILYAEKKGKSLFGGLNC